jgi:hypothetical protein
MHAFTADLLGELITNGNLVLESSLSPVRTRFKEITHWAKIGFC